MKKVKLGEIIKIHNGRKCNQIFNNGKYPVYGSGGVMGYSNDFLISGEIILLPRKGSLGNVFYQNGKVWNIDTIYASTVKNNELHNAKFIYYYVKTLDLSSLETGSALPSMTQTAYNEIIINLPDYSTQQKIAAILSSLDDKIETNNKIASVLEKMMKEIYNYWFVQFDFSDKNGKPYQSNGGKMVYNPTLKRLIPKGWEVENVFENSLSKPVKVKLTPFTGEKIYYDTASVNYTNINSDTKVDFENKPSRANMQPVENSIWFAKMKESPKYITVLPSSNDLLNEAIFSTGFFGIKANDEIYLPYLRTFIFNPDFELQKDRNSHGATQKAVNEDGIKNIPLIVPKDEIIKMFHRKVSGRAD